MQRKLISAVAILFVFAAGLVSQSTPGGQVITGTVTDASNAVVVGAKVTATLKSTNTVTTTVTSNTGNFTLWNLQVGVYTVVIEAKGFKTYRRENIQLDTDQKFRLDAKIEVGSESQTVTVTSDASQLRTDSSAITHNITLKDLQDLPSFNIGTPAPDAAGTALRDPYAVADMLPGVRYNRDANVMLINGLPKDQVQYRIDGQITGLTPAGVSNLARGAQPSPDAIEEIAITTSNYSAALGSLGGALFNANGQLQDTPNAQQLLANIRGGVDPRSVAGNTADYQHYLENEFATPQANPLSTFGTDVDTASYSNARRFLTAGQLPPPDAVRVEEMINYFRYDYPQPEPGKPVSLTTHLVKSPWNSQALLLQVGLRTKQLANEDLPPSHLTFLIDVSGSMMPAERLPLIQQSLQMLVRQLRPQDTVALTVYAGAAGVVLPPTSGEHKQDILNAIGRLQAGGSTAGAAGIRMAYQVAKATFNKEHNNRVILATDGDFNVGVTSDNELVSLIEEERKSGVFLSVIGVGTDNLKDSKMQKLADHGNGNYIYLDSLAEARKALVEELGATLVTVAKDVKLQIEFNPARVKAYRLVGYEKRKLRPEDFNDDTKDAGDLGAGHQVTAFYEIIPSDDGDLAAAQEGLRYQQPPKSAKTSDDRNSNELAFLKLRYKEPQSDTSQLLEWPVTDRTEAFRSAPADTRFAVAVAEYGMLLRRSRFAGTASFRDVIETAADALGEDLDGYRTGFVELARRAGNLAGGVISQR